MSLRKLRCASCGWSDEVNTIAHGYDLARHLRVCPGRDESRYIPRWSIWDDEIEGAWTTVDHDSRWHPFAIPGLREIGVSP